MNEKKLTVGIFTHDFYPFIGGQGRFVYELFNQNKLHEQVKIIVFSPASNQVEDHIQIFPETVSSKFKNIEFSIKLATSLEELVKKYRLDLVHFQGGPGGVFVLKKPSVPSLYTCHHTYWQQSRFISEQKWKKIFNFFEKSGYLKVDSIICDCDASSKVLSEQYGIPNTKLETIPIGLDLTRFKPNLDYAKSKNILYVGRIDTRKGLDFLLNSMVLVNNQDNNIQLHVVGKGKDKSKLEHFSESRGLNVKFYGFITDEELENLYNSISIQVIPSVFEGFGLSVLEGMARKVAVIGTDVPGVNELIQHQSNGILVPYGDVKELANNIVYLLNDYGTRKKFIIQAYEDLNKYDWNDIYARTISHYEKLYKKGY